MHSRSCRSERYRHRYVPSSEATCVQRSSIRAAMIAFNWRAFVDLRTNSVTKFCSDASPRNASACCLKTLNKHICTARTRCLLQLFRCIWFEPDQGESHLASQISAEFACLEPQEACVHLMQPLCPWDPSMRACACDRRNFSGFSAISFVLQRSTKCSCTLS